MMDEQLKQDLMPDYNSEYPDLTMTDLEQLEALKAICLLIEEKSPKRRARATFVLDTDVKQGLIPTIPVKIKKELRAGVVFYWKGWGWRLRKGWQETLERKIVECQSD